MTLPNQGSGADQFKAQIVQWIRDEIAKAAQGGANGSLHIDGPTGNLIIDNGDIRSGNYVAGTSGWDLAPTGNAEFNSLTLRGGIIGNDALTNPVNFGGIGYSATAFTVTSSSTAVVTRTITIPTGFTQAAIIGVSTAGAVNGSTGAGYLYIQTVINGTGGAVMPAYGGPSGGWAFVAASAMRTLSGLTTPGVITVTANLYASGAWGSNASNIANLDVICLFSR